jgi:iron complex transport system substrate-binding protein
MLFAIGAGEELVGVTHECDFPAAALALPRLTSSALAKAERAHEIDRHVRASVHAGSSLYHLDAALLERLQPDLIVTQELCPVCAVSYEIVDRAVKRLRGDPRIVSLEPSSLEDVLANVLALGEITGHADGAEALVDRLRARIERLRERCAGEVRRPRALVLEWTDPPMGAGHWSPGLVELAGATPLLGNPGGNSPRLSWEQIAHSDPDSVVVAPCGFDLAKTRAAVEELAAVPEWSGLRALAQGRVLLMDGSAYMNRPGPRLVDTAEQMAAFFHSA